MTTTKRATLWLGFLALVAGLLSWWAIARWQQQRRPGNPPLLLAVDGPAVTEITLTNPSGRFVVERTGGGTWILTAPEKTVADAGAILELLSAVEEAKSHGRLDATAERNLYGLSPPLYTLTLAAADGRRWHLEAGKQNRFSGQIYVRTGSEAGSVWLTDGALRYQLSRGLMQLREKRLLVVDAATITGIAVRRPDTSGYEIERRDEGFWLTEPPSGRVDPRAEKDLLAAVGNLKARRFLVPAPGQEERQTYGLSPAFATRVTVTFASPRPPVTILLAPGKTKDVNYATLVVDAPIVELASSFIFTQTRLAPEQLRDQRILSFARDEVATVILHQPPTHFSLHRRRERGRWRWDLRRADGSVAPAKASEVFALQYKLWSLRRDRRLDEEWVPARLADRGLGKDGTRIVLQNGTGGVVAELRLGDFEGTGRLVSTGGSGAVDWVAAEKLDALVFSASHYLATDGR